MDARIVLALRSVRQRVRPSHAPRTIASNVNSSIYWSVRACQFYASSHCVWLPSTPMLLWPLKRIDASFVSCAVIRSAASPPITFNDPLCRHFCCAFYKKPITLVDGHQNPVCNQSQNQIRTDIYRHVILILIFDYFKYYFFFLFSSSHLVYTLPY